MSGGFKVQLIAVSIALGGVGAVGVGKSAAFQTPTPIVRHPILGVKVSPGKNVASVTGVRIDFVPGQRTGLHLHPMPTVGHVTRGEIRFQVEGEPPRTLQAGDAFHEPANARILLFDNASDRAPASFVVFYLMGADDHDLIKMLE